MRRRRRRRRLSQRLGEGIDVSLAGPASGILGLLAVGAWPSPGWVCA
ncbi:hypothetical protein [Frankia sp. ACN1ag]|nr:hypothetical protein [Frankia sp. ACN1ag]